MTIDLARARAETRGCEGVIHLNNAGAALMPAPVIDAVVDHLRLEERIGGYEANDREVERLEATYRSIARLLNAEASEVAVIENATRAWDMGFYGMPLKPGDKVLTCMAEYGSNYISFLQQARRTGCEIVVVPDDAHGQIDVAALERMIDPAVKLIAITHVPTGGGLVNPAAAIGRVARAAGVPYLLDACQSVGQMPIDVKAIGCTMLSATGRKFLRGPRGTGFLWVDRDFLERLDPPFLDNHAATWIARDEYKVRPDARRFENWESFVAGKAGLKAAVDYALGWGLEAIRDRCYALAGRLRAGLSQVKGVRLADTGLEQCAIVTFETAPVAPGEVKAALRRRGINCSASNVASTRLSMEARGIETVVRMSVHYYNSEAEIDLAVAAVDAVLRG
ncbi:MAG: aminotransferase class V-fold PLP-dependent enzyme [Thalassobaculales bacterium]